MWLSGDSVSSEVFTTAKYLEFDAQLYPNFIWHADGYDKLGTFGIRIHGCIDG